MKVYNQVEAEPYAVALEPEWCAGSMLEPLMLQDDDEILLDEELTAEDIAQIERLQASWLREAKSEAAQVARDLKEDLAARGVDITEHLYHMAVDDPERDRIAKRLGYGKNWDSNSERREADRKRAAARNSATSRAADLLAAQKFTAESNAPAPPPPPAPIAQPVVQPIAPSLPDMEIIAAVLPPILERYAKGTGPVKRSALWELATARVNGRRPASFVSNMTEAQRKDCDVRLAFAWREAVEVARLEIERAEIAAGCIEDARIRVSAAMARVCEHYKQLRREHVHPRLRFALDGSWERLCYMAQKLIDGAATSPVSQDLSSWERAACRAADGALSMALELLQRKELS